MSPKFLCQRNRYNDISTIYWISPRCFPPPYATDSGGLSVFNDWLTDWLTTEDPQYHHTSLYWLLEPLLASEENQCERYPLLVSIEMDKHFKTGALVLLPKSQSNPTQNTATDTVSVTLPLFGDMVVGRHQQQVLGKSGRLPDAGWCGNATINIQRCSHCTYVRQLDLFWQFTSGHCEIQILQPNHTTTM